MPFIQVSLGKREFHCNKFDVMKEIEKFYLLEECKYLISGEKELLVKDTKAYQKLQEALEYKKVE